MGVEASCLMYIFEEGDEFVFELGGWGPWVKLCRYLCLVGEPVPCCCSPEGP